MTIAILVVLVFTLMLLVYKARNKRTFAFGLGFLSVDMLILALAFYTIKINNYRYFFQFEFSIIKYLGKVNISYYDIRNLMIASIVAFSSVMVFFFIGEISEPMSRKKKHWYAIIFFIAAIAFLYVNSTDFLENIFLWAQYASDGRTLRLIGELEKAIPLYSCAFIAIICALPYFRLIAEYNRTRLNYRKNYLRSLLLAIVFLQGLFFFVLFFTPLRFHFVEFGIYNIQEASLIYTKSFDYYILIITIVLLTILGFIFIKSYLLSEIDIFKRSYKLKTSRYGAMDIRHIFHTLKNMMALFLILNNKAIDSFGSDEGMDTLLEMKNNVIVFSDRIKKTLDIYNHPMLTFEHIAVTDCVGNAVSNVKKMKNVNIEMSIECENPMIYADGDELTEAFFNIIYNSVEAVAADGKIVIEVWQEDKWICVSVWDNGCGIEKKLLKNIFKPFISGKKSFNNWGIGLAQVKKIIEANFGFISVKSSVGEFTEFQVILPKTETEMNEEL